MRVSESLMVVWVVCVGVLCVCVWMCVFGGEGKGLGLAAFGSCGVEEEGAVFAVFFHERLCGCGWV